MTPQEPGRARSLEQRHPGTPTSDGAGVKLLRALHGTAMQRRLDPWLMLDYFASDQPNDYIAGFPDHPHRGFETITIMLEGRMLHRDSRGNQGLLEPGDVQWMSAARGLVHSEMPQQDNGRLAGYQLWINLPARHKMDEPRWQDIPSSRIPRLEDGTGGWIRLIAGSIPRHCFVPHRPDEAPGPSETPQAALAFTHATASAEVTARMKGPLVQPLTSPVIVEGRLTPQADLMLPLPGSHNAFIFALQEGLRVNAQALAAQTLGVLGNEGDHVRLSGEGRFLLAAARPLNEAIAQMGPFVMNTREELMQALHDYQSGRLG
jgi:redox-sensitive bicupin YhaK (pirin superfamily)